MKERSIIFSGEMVKAILDGRKTQTRRVLSQQIKPESTDLVMCRPADNGFGKNNYQRWGVMFKTPQNEWLANDKPILDFIPCPYGQPGDRLWVRETLGNDGDGSFWYEADTKYIDNYPDEETRGEWERRNAHKRIVPSIHMPRWASRITLEITNVRVEKLQEITHEDCVAEGMIANRSPEDEFQSLWNKIHGASAWDKNPWVWVIEFVRKELINDQDQKEKRT